MRRVLASVAAATLALGAARGAEPPEAAVERLSPRVAELRGLPFARPVPVEVVDDTVARHHWLERWRRFLPEPELRRAQRAHELLGLLPPGLDVLEVFQAVMREQAGGFYDPQTRAFYLLDDLPADAAPVVIVHELTHALEDQHFDLDRRLGAAERGDDDRLLALSAVHEGSATLLMTTFVARGVLDGEVDARALAALAEFGESERLERLPPLFRRQLLAPYLLGTSFLLRGDPLGLAAGGYPAADVDAAFAESPQSSEQILHPETYWDAAALDLPRRVDLGDAGALLGRGWSRAASGVLGELSLGLLVGAPTPDPRSGIAAQRGTAWTNAAAEGWGGDRWELWQRGDAAVVLLATVWDSRHDAAEFAAALPRRRDLVWRRQDDRVAIVAGPSHPRAGRVLGALVALEGTRSSR